PAVQDLWMLLSGDRSQQTVQLSEALEGYREFCDFDTAELHLAESYRTLRLMNYAAWLARRWQDPAFPKAFPWFNTERYWSEHILSLREQLGAIDEPALQVF
ncbi:MAG: stress response kinase A, partial [Cellvibrionaceae bacterium]|nr:stress response kinase A [Cellvibrionaceae bacterium]